MDTLTPLVAETDATTGEERRTFEAADVFFSTTDTKGVITHANETFLRLARLETDAAIGSPHNLIRHPGMPGGAFRLVWDELEAGRPVCLYMANRASDGVRYDVAATISPIDGGYLSVRLRPGVAELERGVLRALDATRAAEQQWQEGGVGRHERAERGSQVLLEQLADLGYASMADLTRAVLPREVEAFLAAVPPARAMGAGPGPLPAVLRAAQSLGVNVGAFATRLADFEDLARRVQAERESVTPVLGDLRRVGSLLQEVAAAVADPDLAARTRDMDGWIGEAIAGLEDLPGQLDDLQRALRDLALRTSMLVLHTHTVSRFTSEVIASGQERGTELRLLSDALAHALAQAERQVEDVTRLLREIPEQVEAAVRSTDKVEVRADGWRAAVTADQAPAEARAAAEEVCRVMRTQLQPLGEIVGLSARMRQTPVRFEVAQAREQVQHIAAGVAGLA